MYWSICSPQLEAGLLLDTAKGTDRNIPLRMWNGDTTRLHGMLELDVTPLSGHLTPTVILKNPDDIAAPHVYEYT
jgi:hypothetical protein